MSNVAIPPELTRDPQEKNVPGMGLGRDPARTPMQWDASPDAGFCPPGVRPWLPVAPDYEQVNVAVEREDKTSMLSLTRALLALRCNRPALNRGSYRGLENDSQDCFTYLRQFEDERLLVALNFTEVPRTVSLPQLGEGHVLLSTAQVREEGVDLAGFSLAGHEGCVIEIFKGS